jgi:hypothetical protein
MLWALAARIRDERYAATVDDMKALLGSGCARARIREVLSAEAARWPEAPFSVALSALETVKPTGKT